MLLKFALCLVAFFFVFNLNADSNLNDATKEIVLLECEKFNLDDGTHYLKVTQSVEDSFIFEVACSNGNMLVDSAYMKYFQNNGDVNDEGEVNSLSSEITVADDEVKSGINPIDDSPTAYKKWKSKYQYVVFLVIIIMISVFGFGVFFNFILVLLPVFKTK